MTIEEILELFIDDSQNIRVFDLHEEEEIFCGDSRDLDDAIKNYTICSIDNIYPNNDGYICFNVDTSEEE